MANFTENINPQELYWNAVKEDVQYRASETVGKYLLFIIFLFGSVGNLLSFAIMVRPTMRSSSTAFYMATLALADTAVLLVGCLRRWVLEVFEKDLLNAGPVACVLINFLQYWSFDVAVWILVTMTIDRAIVVISPLKAYIYATRGRAMIAIIIVMIVSAGKNTHFFFTAEYTKQTCTAKEKYLQFYSEIWANLDAAIYSFIPFILLLIMNIVIIIFLSRANIKKERMTNHFKAKRKAEQNNHINSRKLSIMLLSVSTAFLLLTGPAAVLHIIREQGEKFFDLNIPKDMARYILTRQVIRVLMYINHSINFFLYCLTGHKFRGELVAMLRCQRERDIRRRSTIASLQVGSTTNFSYVAHPTTSEHESTI